VSKVALWAARHAAREAFVAEICARDLEGIMAKRKLGIYKDDVTGWLKLKKPTYSQVEGRHPLLTHGR
jgi:ATP-dependent DNA ligase